MADEPDVFELNVEQIRQFCNNPLFDLVQTSEEALLAEQAGTDDTLIFDEPRFLEDPSLVEDDFLREDRKLLFNTHESTGLAKKIAIPLLNKIGFSRLMRRTVHDMRRSRVQMAADHASQSQGIASDNGTLTLRVGMAAKISSPQEVEDQLLAEEQEAAREETQ